MVIIDQKSRILLSGDIHCLSLDMLCDSQLAHSSQDTPINGINMVDISGTQWTGYVAWLVGVRVRGTIRLSLK